MLMEYLAMSPGPRGSKYKLKKKGKSLWDPVNERVDYNSL